MKSLSFVSCVLFLFIFGFTWVWRFPVRLFTRPFKELEDIEAMSLFRILLAHPSVVYVDLGVACIEADAKS